MLWVQQYEFDTTYKSGWKHKHLPGPDAFGFVDPQTVLRGSHLLPVFALSLTDEYLMPDSMAHQFKVLAGEQDEFEIEQEDWKYYYAGM